VSFPGLKLLGARYTIKCIATRLGQCIALMWLDVHVEESEKENLGYGAFHFAYFQPRRTS